MNTNVFEIQTDHFSVMFYFQMTPMRKMICFLYCFLVNIGNAGISWNCLIFIEDIHFYKIIPPLVREVYKWFSMCSFIVANNFQTGCGPQEISTKKILKPLPHLIVLSPILKKLCPFLKVQISLFVDSTSCPDCPWRRLPTKCNHYHHYMLGELSSFPTILYAVLSKAVRTYCLCGWYFILEDILLWLLITFVEMNRSRIQIPNFSKARNKSWNCFWQLWCLICLILDLKQAYPLTFMVLRKLFLKILTGDLKCWRKPCDALVLDWVFIWELGLLDTNLNMATSVWI